MELEAETRYGNLRLKSRPVGADKLPLRLLHQTRHTTDTVLAQRPGPPDSECASFFSGEIQAQTGAKFVIKYPHQFGRRLGRIGPTCGKLFGKTANIMPEHTGVSSLKSCWKYAAKQGSWTPVKTALPEQYLHTGRAIFLGHSAGINRRPGTEPGDGPTAPSGTKPRAIYVCYTRPRCFTAGPGQGC